MQFTIPKEKIDSFFQIDLSKFYLLDKRMLSTACFYTGILIAYFGSLHPWFMWGLGELYPIPAAFFVFMAYLISNSMEQSLFLRRDFLLPLLAYILLTFTGLVTKDRNINIYIVSSFTVFIFFGLLKLNVSLLQNLATFLCKAMALLLIPSMFFFMLHILGFGLPFRNAAFGDNYSFSNYYFFMIEDGFLSELIPRFQSVFLEPGHLGSATSILLMTQFGQWKRWWNVVLLLASAISFSLAAYAILIALSFLALWTQRKKLVRTVLATLAIIALGALMATFYNGGDNMVNNLILARLEVNERTGEMEGNNRVDVNFEKEFDKYIVTSDAIFGREMHRIPKGTGNSGYRVYIYQNGLAGLFLLILFYGLSFRNYTDRRYYITAIIISVLIFWIRGYPLWYSNFIPILVTAYKAFKPAAPVTSSK